MQREVIHVPTMPVTNPTYSQVIRAGELLFLAGQIGLDYAAGQLVKGGIREQTRQTLDNISLALQSADATLESVVSVTVYITNWDNWADFNEVYATYFPHDGPAKTTAEVNRLALDALVEIQITAVTS